MQAEACQPSIGDSKGKPAFHLQSTYANFGLPAELQLALLRQAIAAQPFLASSAALQADMRAAIAWGQQYQTPAIPLAAPQPTTADLAAAHNQQAPVNRRKTDARGDHVSVLADALPHPYMCHKNANMKEAVTARQPPGSHAQTAQQLAQGCTAQTATPHDSVDSAAVGEMAGESFIRHMENPDISPKSQPVHPWPLSKVTTPPLDGTSIVPAAAVTPPTGLRHTYGNPQAAMNIPPGQLSPPADMQVIPEEGSKHAKGQKCAIVAAQPAAGLADIGHQCVASIQASPAPEQMATMLLST